MSGLIKSIGKTFKSVLKVAKVVLPIALAVGAIVFTGGAALGLALPAWGTAVAGVFGTSALGTIAAGAVTAAGYGAVIGGATSALMGKSVIKGMQAGAVTGAVTGGVMAGVGYTPGLSPAELGSKIDPLADWANARSGSAAANAAVPGAADAPVLTDTPQASTAKVRGMMSTPADATPPPAAGGTAAPGFWSGAAGPIAGAALTGLGTGIASGQPDPTLAQRGANYQTGPAQVAAPGSQPASTVLNPGGRSGADLNARTPNRNGRWKYNTDNNEFEFIPTT